MSLYSVRQRKSSHAPTSSVPHWWTETPTGGASDRQETPRHRKSAFISVRETERERAHPPGSERVAQVSLFLLFLSFLNFGTRRNFALRLRFEKSVKGPLWQTGRQKRQTGGHRWYPIADISFWWIPWATATVVIKPPVTRVTVYLN